ncbi:hypothetical protein C0Q70_19343 [Pomacea canaliculata]|uniref:protein-glutamine gamma-glutamyltransferase n=1 Tax=Pomacea canaliculata TaxID=400727 RepID=A0A2T7NJ50_POMCA|nr:hemocyte protein-glutamine gamma-glutamyltransferase-like isoform X2 [Pomacea canaliculata]PVD21176.1 hypothetical protein C0Q70_19343 [Pomacea canaliculata]
MGCVSSIPICQQCAKKRSSDAVLTNINTTTTPVDVASHPRYDRTTDIGRRNTAAFPNDVSLVSSDIREPDPALDKDVLRVENVDFKVKENTRAHNTFEYDIAETEDPKLVIRRGQPFSAVFTFSRPYNAEQDDLRLVFQIGDRPIVSKGTHVEFVLSDKDEPNQWGAKIDSQSGNTVNVTFFTPPDCIVGKWSFKVDVVRRTDNQTSVFRYNYKDPIYILFNPWCKEDAVYMENEAARKEYVLRDTGKVFTGTTDRITGKPWAFAQFDGKVLDCCIYLLENSDINIAVRGNPIPVARKLTAMINAQDEGGVLAGNWSGDYSGGKSPLSWSGSRPILELYYAQKSTVKFGQCWVFSGVLTTVFRALGIPARSVTNFASAHDSDTSITIDSHFNANGEPMEHKNVDSVWNFHVWNEAWMARPDLSPGYGGWQACDATPQETSDGVYCCGPASVRAIREGEVNLPYDGPFVFAEVNADKVYWRLNKITGKDEVVQIVENVVGKNISTLALGSDEREDITKYYKPPEGSAEERVSVRRANLLGSKLHNIYTSGPEDVKVEVSFDTDTFVGQDVMVKLQATNTSKEQRTLDGLMTISTMYYTGVVDRDDRVGQENIEHCVLQPGETKDILMTCHPQGYLKKLKDCCMFSVTAMTTVGETKQCFVNRTELRLRKPHINIKAPAKGTVGTEIAVEVSFTNPLKVSLTHCYLEVEGPGLTENQRIPQGDVQASGTFIASFKIKPQKTGERELIVNFNCDQLEDVNGSCKITVS